MNPTSFYDRREWRELRFRVLGKYGWTCMACGCRGSRLNPIQVDHVVPIFTAPERALDESNLQVLCKLCNLGKSNKTTDDLRPHDVPVDIADERELRRIVRELKREIAKSIGPRQQRLLDVFMRIQREIHRGGQTEEVLTQAVRGIISAELGGEVPVPFKQGVAG